MKQTDKALDKKSARPGAGPLFWQCFARNWLYSRDLPGLRPYLYIIPFFLAYLVLDFSPAVYLPGHGHCGGQIPPGGVVHPGLGTGFRGAGVLPAQGAPVVCPVRAPW